MHPDAKSCRLVFPEIAEPCGNEFRVANGVLNVLVPEILLDGSRIVTIVSKFVTGRMAEHVRMDWKLETSLLASSGNHLANR